MNKVFINGRFLSQSITGVQRVAYEVIKSLDDMIETNEIDRRAFEFILLFPPNAKVEIQLKHIQVKKVGFLKGHLWEQLQLPLYTGGSLLINLCGPAPIMKLNKIVIIHDASVFANQHNFSWTFRNWYKLMYRSFGILSRRIVTVSHFSKSEIVKYCKINPEKISVHHLGVDHFLRVRADYELIKEKIKDKKYILAVSSKSPNKNFEGIIKAVRLLQRDDIECVIAGGNNTRVFTSHDGLDSAEHSMNVRYLGYVSDEELISLYKHAECFVYPSFYEGFGLPPVEAMAAGCPVVVSNASSLPEVCGKSAVYCDPYNEKDIADKIGLLIDDEKYRQHLIESGRNRAECFQWIQCARGLFNDISRTFKVT
ncbi:glycosyltransferase family 4 protein [Paenibacillus tarimensis]